MEFEVSENVVILVAFVLWASATLFLKIFLDKKKKEKNSTFLERQNLSETKKDSRKENKNLKNENVSNACGEDYDTKTARKMVERMTANSIFFHGGISHTTNESVLRASDDEPPPQPTV